MAKKEKKTNAMRLLDEAGIAYDVNTYEIADAEFSGTAVADLLGQPHEMVFKTLVVGEGRDHFVALVPVDCELSLKKLGALVGKKHLTLVPTSDIFALTGYVRGACSPLGMRRHLPTFIHESMAELTSVGISAGAKGTQILLAPSDLWKLTDATLGDICI